MEAQKSVVIDCGSGTIKAGFTGEDRARSEFPSVVGRSRFNFMLGLDGKEVHVGDEAMFKRGVLNLTYPIDRGNIKDWNDIEIVW